MFPRPSNFVSKLQFQRTYSRVQIIAKFSATKVSAPYVGIPVSVKAYYVGRGIDILRVHSNIYGTSSHRQEFQPKSVTVAIDESLNQYIAVYKYGSVVMFNIPEAVHLEHLRRIKETAVITPIAEGLQHTEEYRIMINPELDKPSVIKAEHLNIRGLDPNNIAIVGTVMAQTVALDFYAVATEKMLESFMLMNMKIQEKGDFEDLKMKELYKLVASNNTVVANVLSKLGIFEGSDAAWENADYNETWELLRKDFEIDNRYKDLSLKLDIVKDNTRFFLEILHNQKSTKLEWIIIFLIATEILIGFGGLVTPYVTGTSGGP